MSKRRTQEELFAECLSASETGRSDRDQCLAQDARDDVAWHDLVSLALELRQMPSPPPSASFRLTGYHNLMKEIGQKSGRRRRPRRIPWSAATLCAGTRLRVAFTWVSVLVAVILCLGTGGAVLAAEGALPGDPLYGLKTAAEDVRLVVAPAEDDVSLHARFAGRRLDEIEALVTVGRLADVPQAAAGYETHVEQAIQALAAMEDKDADAREQLAADLDQMLSEQTAAWDALASQVPAQMAPLIQQVQSTSADAQSAIRQLRTKPDMEGTTKPPDLTPTRPLPDATQPPPADTSTVPIASTPLPPPPHTPADPSPADTLPAPPADTPLAPPADTPFAPPADTPVPPPADTPVPPPADTPVPPPADTPVPPPGDTPVPPPADTPVAPPPPGEEPPRPAPAGPPLTDAGQYPIRANAPLAQNQMEEGQP